MANHSGYWKYHTNINISHNYSEELDNKDELNLEEIYLNVNMMVCMHMGVVCIIAL